MSINNGHDDERNSVEECQHLCQQTDGCNVFTWYSERKWCWLKSGIAASIELQGAISGPKQCGRSNKVESLVYGAYNIENKMHDSGYAVMVSLYDKE